MRSRGSGELQKSGMSVIAGMARIRGAGSEPGVESRRPRFCLARNCQDCPPSKAGISVGVAVVGMDAPDQEVLDGIFQYSSEFHCRGWFANADNALRNVTKLGAQIWVVQMCLPDSCGIKCARGLRQQCPTIQIVLGMSLRDRVFVSRACTAGVSAFVICPLEPAQCLATLRSVSCTPDNQSSAVTPDKSSLAESAVVEPAYHGLTARDQRILSLLAEGLLNKEMEGPLGLSGSMLKKLESCLYRKLGVHNRIGAVEKWGNLGGRRH